MMLKKFRFVVPAVLLAAGVMSVAAQDATATTAPTALPPVAYTAVAQEFAGESDNFAGVDPSGVTITYWHQYNSPNQLAAVTGLVDQFNATNPYGITVNAISQGSYGDIRTAMNSAIVSGDLPNLVAGYNNDALSYDLDDVVVDLQTYYTDAKWGYSGDTLDELNQNVLNAFVFNDGRRLGWVQQVTANVLVVNDGMLEQLGFAAGAPTTLDEFKQISCAAAQSDLTGAEGGKVQGFPIVADASQFESLVASLGGSIFVDGSWNFTNPQSMTVLQLLADLYSEGCGYIPAERFGNTNDFARGLNPMAMTSTAGISIIIRGIGEAGDAVTSWSVTVTPPLNAGDTPAIQIYTPGIAMLSGTPEENLAAWIFLRYFTQADVSQQWSELMSAFPVNLSAAASFQPANAYFGTVNNLIASGDVNIYGAPAELTYSEVRNILATGIADVTSGGLDVNEVAQRMNDEAAAVLAGN